MVSIFDLPSWNENEMTLEQKTQFQIEEVGESMHSGRRCFRVTCVRCGKCVHSSTNNPAFHMDLHVGNCFESEM